MIILKAGKNNTCRINNILYHGGHEGVSELTEILLWKQEYHFTPTDNN